MQSITDSTISNGNEIYSESTLTIADSNISSNGQAYEIYSESTLTITDSTISNADDVGSNDTLNIAGSSLHGYSRFLGSERSNQHKQQFLG